MYKPLLPNINNVYELMDDALVGKEFDEFLIKNSTSPTQN